MGRITKTQREQAQREAEIWLQTLLDSAKKEKAAEESYQDSVGECSYSYCMHFNENKRRCSLLECFYDDDAIEGLEAYGDQEYGDM